MKSTSPPAAAAPTSARYFVGVLGLIYLMNFLDRSVINILSQYIKEDLHLSDTQLGVLGGIAFATLYAVLGLPVARLAERFNRVAIISTALAIWSLMTCLCGFAGGFWQLFLARVGVGIGEAGCTPSAHSLIADLFPPQRRATAFSVYALGIPIGALVGITGGGWLGHAYGWRIAFMAVGAPGIAVALLSILTLKEPIRGQFDAAAPPEPPPVTVVARTLFREPAFVQLLIGMTVCTFGLAGVQAFLAPMILRGDFGMNLAGIAAVIGPLAGVAQIAGTGVGGALADWASRWNKGAYLWIPGVALCIAGLLMAVALFQTQFASLAVCYSVAQFFALLYIGPSFAVIHNLSTPRMRASAIAIVYLSVNLIGTGLGPVAAGALSDLLTRRALSSHAAWSDCLHSPAAAVCRDASFHGVRAGLVVMACCLVWAGLHYCRGGAHLARRGGGAPHHAPDEDLAPGDISLAGQSAR